MNATETLLPTHPAIEAFRAEFDECAEHYDSAELWGTRVFLANCPVEREYGFRFDSNAVHAILTAPAIATEPGRMGDALRLIASVFDYIERKQAEAEGREPAV